MHMGKINIASAKAYFLIDKLELQQSNHDHEATSHAEYRVKDLSNHICTTA